MAYNNPYQVNPHARPYGGHHEPTLNTPVKNRNNTIDVHSLLTKQIYAQNKDYDEPKYQEKTFVADYAPSSNTKESAGFEDTEIYFDSVNTKTSSNLKDGEMTFDISGLNNNQDVKNFVQMTIGSFWFPIPLFNIDPTLPNPYFFRTVFMQIVNVPDSQAIKGYNSARFQYEFDVEEINSIAVKLVPKKNSIYLTRPMIGLSELQVRFMYPLNFKRIPVPKTVIDVISVGESNPGLFLLQGDDITTEILGPIGVPAAPGIAVFGSGYNSVLKPSQNPIVNNPQGIYITEIVDAKTIRMATLDFLGAGDAIPTRFVVGKNRLAFSIRFTGVQNIQTNYLSGVHI